MASFDAFLVVFYAIQSYKRVNKRPVIDPANQRVPGLRPWRPGPTLIPACTTLVTYMAVTVRVFCDLWCSCRMLMMADCQRIAITSVFAAILIACCVVYYDFDNRRQTQLHLNPPIPQQQPEIEDKSRTFQVSIEHKENPGLPPLRTTDEFLSFTYGEGKISEYDHRLLDYIRSFMARPSPKGRRLSKIVASGHYSQVDGSQLVDKLLKRRRNGFFIECGAYRGEDLSDTLFFELKRNWTGLLIEAHPDYFRQILKKNRQAIALRACLSVTRSPQLMKFKLSGWGSGISSTYRNYKTKPDRETDVQCFSINSIMAAIGVRHVDFFVLDVEGAEIPILKTIDWSRLTIDVLNIEYSEIKVQDRLKKLKDLRAYFNSTHKEVGTLPSERPLTTAQDVIFIRRNAQS